MKISAKTTTLSNRYINRVTLISENEGEAKEMMLFAAMEKGKDHKQEIEDLKRALQAVTNDKEIWRKTHIDLHKENQELKKEIESLLGNIEDLREEKDDYYERYIDVIDENDAILSELAQLKLAQEFSSNKDLQEVKLNIARTLVKHNGLKKLASIKEIRECFSSKNIDLSMGLMEAKKLIETAMNER